VENSALKARLPVLAICGRGTSACSMIFFMVSGVIEKIMEEEIADMQIGHELLLVMGNYVFFGIHWLRPFCPSL